ncbi:DNA-directed RNA polymerase sigma-70 factor [Bacteroidia bacterium]|nr:DNA-directed RNA polymerase sigma-70 factor [Bacteroidia bacterium]GHV72012.1 DNA-directed RNA polymerase sigma-70 factor [Bacteroidia bacterium]
MSKHNQREFENDFIRMVRVNEKIIYKVCSFYVSENFPMEDLYQETVSNLWKAFPKFRNESSHSTWIYKIALNTCISGMRKENKHYQKVSLSFSEDIAFEPDSMEEDIRELYRLIYQLKTLERAIILLWLEEKSYSEIAEITGLSLSNVATKLKRIKEKLKTMSNQ